MDTWETETLPYRHLRTLVVVPRTKEQLISVSAYRLKQRSHEGELGDISYYVQYSTVQYSTSVHRSRTTTQRTQASTGTLSDDIPPARQPYGRPGKSGRGST